MRRARSCVAVCLVVFGCATPGQVEAVRQAPARSLYGAVGHRPPLTRAERSHFTETSRYADVVQFIDSLKLLGAKIAVGSIGKTTEGRDIPYVIASRPLVSTPAEAKRLDRPIVYVQANIHAGEVEGKEALQALLRDLTLSDRPNVLDSIVLIAVPIYNADGNERFAAQEKNRSEQNGPELVGQRPNAQGLDLNRDYVKAEAPETRASLRMFSSWDPDVFMDLHTTDGSYHGYALTYSPSLNPAALFTAPYTRDTLLPAVRARMRRDEGFEVFDYGNFTRRGAEVAIFNPATPQDTAGLGWATYDHTPRYGTNYYGMRGRISVLSEAFSHDPFARRVASTYDFVYEVLSYVADNATDITDLAHEADRRTTGWGNEPRSGPAIPIRSRMTTHPYLGPVLVEQLAPTGDTTRTQPGVRRGFRRTGRIEAVRMPVYDHFDPILSRPLPYAYAVPAAVADSVVPMLRLHGIAVEALAEPVGVASQAFIVDSVVHAARPFQNHHETTVLGHWAPGGPRTLPAGTFLVHAGQPLGILAAYLLEPESDDSFSTWNKLDPFLFADREYPIVRIAQPFSARLNPVR